MRKEGVQRKRTAKETTFQILKDRIMRQELRAGDSLPEVVISRSLGVSRTPVREAILQLQKEGLVEVIPNRGAYVTFITIKELKNIIQLLQILERAAVDLVLDDLDPAKLEAVEMELLSIKENAVVAAHEKNSKPGIQLHDLILQATGNEKIFLTAKHMREQIRELTMAAVRKRPERVLEFVDEHLRIVKALKEKNGPAAKDALTEHLGNMYKIVTQIIV